MQFAPSPVRVGRGRDGLMLYDVAFGPEELPPVRVRDLEAGWDSAKQAGSGRGCLFRFETPGGPVTLALAQGMLAGLAEASDRILGLGTSQGISLCLRLVALGELSRTGRGPPGRPLLRAVAAAQLLRDGSLDLGRATWPVQPLTLGAHA